MNQELSPAVVILSTNLFNDNAAVEAALTGAIDSVHIDLDPATMTAQDWDNVVSLLLSVPKVITV